MRQLVAEQLVIHLPGVVDRGERACDVGHAVHERVTLGALQLPELGRMTLEHEQRPAGEELIDVQVCVRRPE